ncbi:DUF5693 family protein [Dethiosulfovibrio salsuginis]|uniref:Uncharacterized protein n=1 Tax=Dethiosulfovibrio salsuginis TaxID=561720 RepID=A0A1X7K7B0_9BACT|nr:DUF5693 family protein [Dethiosulfovibrio salsuginis]SMG36169.1 hypothetical protein SAMN06275492_12125 [Dethiosulfovibrio salsuginis]
MMVFSWKRFFALSLLVSLALSLPGLAVRWNSEVARKSSVIVVDWKQIPALASQGEVTSSVALRSLMDQGVRGIIVGEVTGQELDNGVLPLWYGPLEDLPGSLRSALSADLTGTALSFPSNFSMAERWSLFLGLRFPKGRAVVAQGHSVFVIPQTREQLALKGVLPDFAGLDMASELSLPVIYRPAPRGMEPSKTVIDTVRLICERYNNVIGLAPSGEMVAGYPDISGLVEVVKERNLFVAQVEFSRQIGDKPLQWSVWPRVLSVHSVTDEEISSRRLDRKTIVDRMVRASVERSVSVLLFRVDPLGGGNQVLDRYGTDVKELREILAKRGIDDRWPAPMVDWGWSPTGAVALALVGLACVWAVGRRFAGADGPVSIKLILSFVLAVVGLAVALMQFSFVSRLGGAMVAAFVVTEASLVSLDNWRKPGRAVVVGLIVALVGGLAIASFYGSPLYMMRLKTFSGVKLTLFLPLVLVLLHDMRRREYPESLGELLGRPPIWGELFLAGLLVMAAGLMVYRSGNVSSVPAWEIQMRDTLEAWLVARPRTKEVFLGYPCLVLWCAIRRKDWIPRYREVFRLGAVVGFASVVNTFCHFHTRLPITLWRVFNGWWIGVTIGLLAVLLLFFLVVPLWRKLSVSVE